MAQIKLLTLINVSADFEQQMWSSPLGAVSISLWSFLPVNVGRETISSWWHSCPITVTEVLRDKAETWYIHLMGVVFRRLRKTQFEAEFSILFPHKLNRIQRSWPVWIQFSSKFPSFLSTYFHQICVRVELFDDNTSCEHGKCQCLQHTWPLSAPLRRSHSTALFG